MNSRTEIEIMKDLRSMKKEHSATPIKTYIRKEKREEAIKDFRDMESGQSSVPNSGQMRADDGCEESHGVHPDGVVVASRIAEGKDFYIQFKSEIESRFAGVTIGDDRLLYKDGKRLTKQQAKRLRRKFKGIKPTGKQIKNEQQSSTQTEKVFLNCYKCNKSGHFSFDCPSDQYQNTMCFELNETKEFLVYGTDHETWENVWVMNTYYTNHMCGNRGLFIRMKEDFGKNTNQEIKNTDLIRGTGDVLVNLNGKDTLIEGVYYIPSLDKNVLSLEHLIKQGFKVEVEGYMCHISWDNVDIMQEENLNRSGSIAAVPLQSRRIRSSEEAVPRHPRISSSNDCMTILNTLHSYNLVYKYNDEFRSAFKDLVEWYHEVYLKSCFERPIPPYLSDGTEIDLYDLYMMTLLNGGYVEATVNNAWSYIAMDIGCEITMKYEVKAVYLLYLEGIEWYYEILKTNGANEPGTTTAPPGFKKRRASN